MLSFCLMIGMQMLSSLIMEAFSYLLYFDGYLYIVVVACLAETVKSWLKGSNLFLLVKFSMTRMSSAIFNNTTIHNLSVKYFTYSIERYRIFAISYPGILL